MLDHTVPGELQGLAGLIKDIYGAGSIPLHRPVFEGRERQVLVECIDSNFVSSVGARVAEFEQRIASFVGCRHAVATVNGTSALHAALLVAGVTRGDEVLAQSLTFVATCNAISYIGARPVFLDVEVPTLGLSPDALRSWLTKHTKRKDGNTFNSRTGARIAACVPMHTFGIPCRIAEIADICAEYGIELIEDAAESLGSYIGARHTGTYGRMGAISFNGNKIVTTGGGGMIVTDDDRLALRAKHLTTTAKIAHPYEFVHDEVGYNYRMPNLNAALGCAQMEMLATMLQAKAEVAARYRTFCEQNGLRFVDAPAGTTPNFWLNAIFLGSSDERDQFLEYGNSQGIMVRPAWRLMNELVMYEGCQTDGLEQSRWIADRVVNLPSSVPEEEIRRLK